MSFGEVNCQFYGHKFCFTAPPFGEVSHWFYGAKFCFMGQLFYGHMVFDQGLHCLQTAFSIKIRIKATK